MAATITITRDVQGVIITLENESGKVYMTLSDEERLNLAFALLEMAE